MNTINVSRRHFTGLSYQTEIIITIFELAPDMYLSFIGKKIKKRQHVV